MNAIYSALEYSKQAFHKRLDYEMVQEEERHNLLAMVDRIRREHPAISARKIYKMINPVTMGRDKFERMCIESGYGVERKRSFIRTTNSLGVARFDNLIASRELTDTNQVYVSDITYYRIREIFYFITFIMDLFSRKIRGYAVSKDLLTIHTTLPALKMLKANLKEKDTIGCIFHSDGGGQYYNKEFLALTKSMGLRNSMGYSVFENPHAERVNGIIKNEYLTYYNPTDFGSLQHLVKKAVGNYNNRPHQELGGLTPNQIETMQDDKTQFRMKISDYKVLNPFDLINKSNDNLGTVKGKMNGATAQANLKPPLTVPKLSFKY